MQEKGLKSVNVAMCGVFSYICTILLYLHILFQRLSPCEPYWAVFGQFSSSETNKISVDKSKKKTVYTK